MRLGSGVVRCRSSRAPDITSDRAAAPSGVDTFVRVKLTSDRELMSLASAIDGSKR